MDRHQPEPAPPPRLGMVITGGYCPEFWRWRVAACSDKGLTLHGSRKAVLRLAPDQWLPFLAGRALFDPVYVDFQRIAPPAAAPMLLPGEVAPAQPASPRGPVPERDLPTRLRAARALLASCVFTPVKAIGKGTRIRVAQGGFPVDVVYDVATAMLPCCTCSRFDPSPLPARVCDHGLAALLRDPKAKTLLLRCLI